MGLSKSSKDGVSHLLAGTRVAFPLSPTPPSFLATSASPGRSFSWGAKHKWSYNSNGKSIAEKVNKANSKNGLRHPYLEHQMFIRHALPTQGWRSASHWKNSHTVYEKNEDPENVSSQKKPDAGIEDWYARWERQQLEKFEAFKNKIDQDPFSALFGKSNKWLSWVADNTPNGAAHLEGQSTILKKKAEEYFKNDKARKAMKETHASTAKEKSAKKDSLHESSCTSTEQQFAEQEYEIDPITLRKIPKTMKPDTPSKEAKVKSSQGSFDIPVKIFKPAPRVATTPAKGNSMTQVDDWLAREGFGSPKDVQKPMSSEEYGTSLTPKKPASRIQSALDRHIQENDGHYEESYPLPANQPKEKMDDDIDSLRASDIRAAVGKGSQHADISDFTMRADYQPSEHKNEQMGLFLKEKMKRDETDFKHLENLNKKAVLGTSAGLDCASKTTKDLNEILTNKGFDASIRTVKPSNSSSPSPAEIAKVGKVSSFTNSKVLHIQSKIVPLKAQLDTMKVEYDALREAWLAETRRLKINKISELHRDEVAAQKAAMEAAEVHRGEGDMAPNVHHFLKKKMSAQHDGGEASRVDGGGEGDMAPNVAQYASRDRWYKRKAPHAECEMEAKMQQLSKDKALVREVREIYENSYGVIDTKHRQEEFRGEGDMSPNVAQFASRDRWYKRKAPFNSEVAALPKAEISENKGHMMLMEDPSAELLTKDAAAASTPPHIPDTAHQIADLKAQLKLHRQELQSLRSQQQQQQHQNKGAPAAASVRRMEPVFSGRRHKEKKRASRRRRTFKHVLLTGAITATFCYATGVIVELAGANGL